MPGCVTEAHRDRGQGRTLTAAEVSSAFTALLPPPSWSQAEVRGGLDIITWMLRVLAVNLGEERNTQRLALLPKGGGGRTARRKANESLILPAKRAAPASCRAWKKALPLN